MSSFCKVCVDCTIRPVLFRMTAIAYTVLAMFTSKEEQDRYITWLQAGHIDEVIAGGAETAAVVRMDAGLGEINRVEVRYMFRTRDAYDKYIDHVAPGLRAVGLKEFPPESGVRFDRSVGIFQ